MVLSQNLKLVQAVEQLCIVVLLVKSSGAQNFMFAFVSKRKKLKEQGRKVPSRAAGKTTSFAPGADLLSMFQHMLRDDTVEIAGMSLLPPDTAKEALPVLLEATADRFATLLKNPATTDALIFSIF